jgi:hypothetical protein
VNSDLRPNLRIEYCLSLYDEDLSLQKHIHLRHMSYIVVHEPIVYYKAEICSVYYTTICKYIYIYIYIYMCVCVCICI